MSRKIMRYIITGLAIGWVCTTICLVTAKAETVTGHEMAIQFAIWLFASAAYGAANIVYDILDPKVIKATIVHFLISTVITLLTTIIAGYVEFSKWYMFFTRVFPSFVIIYVIITVLIFITTRADAKKINKKLNN